GIGRGARAHRRAERDARAGQRARSRDPPDRATASGGHDVKKPIRTVLADDHQIVREGLRALLELAPGASERPIEVVGEASDGSAALARCEELRPEVIVLDLSLPKLSGMEVAKALGRRVNPPAVVVLSMHISPEHLRQAQELGVSAYVVKGTGVSDLATA